MPAAAPGAHPQCHRRGRTETSACRLSACSGTGRRRPGRWSRARRAACAAADRCSAWRRRSALPRARGGACRDRLPRAAKPWPGRSLPWRPAWALVLRWWPCARLRVPVSTSPVPWPRRLGRRGAGWAGPPGPSGCAQGSWLARQKATPQRPAAALRQPGRSQPRGGRRPARRPAATAVPPRRVPAAHVNVAAPLPLAPAPSQPPPSVRAPGQAPTSAPPSNRAPSALTRAGRPPRLTLQVGRAAAPTALGADRVRPIRPGAAWLLRPPGRRALARPARAWRWRRRGSAG